MSVSMDAKEFGTSGGTLLDGKALWMKAALRWAILGDVLFCVSCSIALMLFNGEIASAIGFDHPHLLFLLGGGLLPWAIFLLLILKDEVPHKGKISLVAVANLGWVIASVIFVAMAGDVINDLGETGILIVAFEVLAFAIWQGAGVKRLPRRFPA